MITHLNFAHTGVKPVLDLWKNDFNDVLETACENQVTHTPTWVKRMPFSFLPGHGHSALSL